MSAVKYNDVPLVLIRATPNGAHGRDSELLTGFATSRSLGTSVQSVLPYTVIDITIFQLSSLFQLQIHGNYCRPEASSSQKVDEHHP